MDVIVSVPELFNLLIQIKPLICLFLRDINYLYKVQCHHTYIILTFYIVKLKLGFTEETLFFLFLFKNIDCGIR